MKTDGSRKLTTLLEETASDDYREKFFEYKTISPMLAAQVGTLASLLGHDYSVFRCEREGREPAYRIRFVSGTGKRGGRRTTFEARLHERQGDNDWMYDVECAGLHNFVCGVGNLVMHNTNEPEYRRLQNNEFMEALRDRTVKIDVPYVTRLKDEIRIYEKDFNTDRVKGKHIAPHTIEIAAMWAVLTRLEQPKHANLTLLQKLKLYNGKTLPGFTEDNVIELKREAVQRGHARHQPALHPGQDLQRHRRSPRRGLRQPVHGHARAGGGTPPPLADHQPGAVAALPRTALRGEGRVRGRRQE